MKKTLNRMLETSKKFHEQKLKDLSYENKDFEKEVYALFSEMFKKEEEIQEDYILKHGEEIHGLDGGVTHEIRRLHRDYFQRLNELKKKYNITDEDKK